MVTEAKESLRKIIDKVRQMPTGLAAVGVAFLSEITSVLVGSNALHYGDIAALGAGMVAVGIHKYNGSRR